MMTCKAYRAALLHSIADPALPRVLERGYAAADFGWGKQDMELLLRASG